MNTSCVALLLSRRELIVELLNWSALTGLAWEAGKFFLPASRTRAVVLAHVNDADHAQHEVRLIGGLVARIGERIRHKAQEDVVARP